MKYLFALTLNRPGTESGILYESKINPIQRSFREIIKFKLTDTVSENAGNFIFRVCSGNKVMNHAHRRKVQHNPVEPETLQITVLPCIPLRKVEFVRSKVT